MRNLALHLSFDGTRYHGWQVQQNAVTVQKTVQDAVEKVFGARLDVTGCSRTDAGVHANDYVFSIRTGMEIECAAVMRALNANLPHDIAVTDCTEVPKAFHPRYFATGKEYLYKIWDAPFRDPFSRAYAFYYPRRLDCALLNEAAQNFLGRHDFAAFCSSGADSSSRPGYDDGKTVRTIFEAGVTRHGDMVEYRVHGDGFLYNMVRIMVGTLLFVARKKIPPCGVAQIINSRDRKRAGPTAPAHGLYLNHVFYDDKSIESERGRGA